MRGVSGTAPPVIKDGHPIVGMTAAPRGVLDTTHILDRTNSLIATSIIR
jgi:hypothetical protein